MVAPPVAREGGLEDRAIDACRDLRGDLVGGDQEIGVVLQTPSCVGLGGLTAPPRIGEVEEIGGPRQVDPGPGITPGANQTDGDQGAGDRRDGRVWHAEAPGSSWKDVDDVGQHLSAPYQQMPW